jgi:dipeptidyl aminopeptidase/acylaminoacyl peptidase
MVLKLAGISISPANKTTLEVTGIFSLYLLSNRQISYKPLMKKVGICFILLFFLFKSFGQQLSNYRIPSKEIARSVTSETTPEIIVSPTGDYLLQLRSPNYISINTLPDNEYRIAGITFNPQNFCRTRRLSATSLILTDIKKKTDFCIEGLPNNLLISNVTWSPDGRYFAFANETNSELELWICQVNQKKAWRLTNLKINALVNQTPIVWQNNSKGLLICAIISDPSEPQVDISIRGPIVFNNSDTWGNLSASANLIKNKNDETCFEHYGTAQLYEVKIDGQTTPVGQPGLFFQALPSPDGKYILIQLIKCPFSYSAPYQAFARKVEIWESNGTLFREVFEIPSSEKIFSGLGATTKTPRNICWRPDVPSTLYWFKALDAGNPDKKAAIRDRLYFFEAPFDGEGKVVFDTEFRLIEIYWGSSDIAFYKEEWGNTGETKIYSFNPSVTGIQKQIVFKFNEQKENPGEFVTKTDYAGQKVLCFFNKNQELLLFGKQIKAFGNIPFINRYNILSMKTDRIWKCDSAYFEELIGVINPDKQEIVTRRESTIDQPNYFARNLRNNVVEQLTNYLPLLEPEEKPFIRNFEITTPDTVNINGDISFPPGFSTGEKKLPVLIWVNPIYQPNKDRVNATLSYSNRFLNLLPSNIHLWSLKGYAVVNIHTLPFYSNPKRNLYPSLTEQLNKLTKALKNYLDSLPNIDQTKICIGGTGEGALIAAQMLFESDYFSAGIGISGIYSTYDYTGGYTNLFCLYNHENQISVVNKRNYPSTPLLLIDGANSINFGQSLQMYISVKSGNGNARLTILPDDCSPFVYNESINQLLWEIEYWLDLNLNKKKK